MNRICVRVCVLWQVLSKNLLEANELLKSHQTQLKATQDKMKALEDHHIAGIKKKKPQNSLNALIESRTADDIARESNKADVQPLHSHALLWRINSLIAP